MKVITTDFEGLLVFQPQTFEDHRGVFYECWKRDSYEKAGIKEPLLQDNTSVSRKNVLRGLHFQNNQAQFISITYGKIFDVAVDIRPNSKTYMKYFSIELDAAHPQQVYMPPGFAHGLCVLSELAIIHYKSSCYYDPSQEGGIIWNDPDIGIQWPIKDIIISEKDKKFTNLKDYVGK